MYYRQSLSKSVVTPSDKQSVGGASTMKDDVSLPLAIAILLYLYKLKELISVYVGLDAN